jgi:DNA polymerase elongation subunit (family B)
VGAEFVNAYQWGDMVRLVRRLQDGSLGMQEVPARWISYLRARDVDDQLRRSLSASRAVLGFEAEGDWVRVSWRDWDARHESLRWFAVKGIAVFEGDVSPVKRILADLNIDVQKPRRCYLDLETDSRVRFQEKERARILSWGITDDAHNEHWGVLESDDDEAERDLLRAMDRVLRGYDQANAWNGDKFDFPMLEARHDRLGLRGWREEKRRLLLMDQQLAFERHDISAESGDEKSSRSLENVAQTKLGIGKEKAPDFVRARFGDKKLAALSWDLWNAGGEFRELLVNYMRQDVRLMPQIEAKTGYLDLQQTICEVCHLFGATRSIQPVAFMDGYMLRLGKQRGFHFPTRPERNGEEREKFAGAYVAEVAAKGIEHDVHVGDFKSLYPTIIRTWNMSPETKRGKRAEPESGECRAPTTGVCFDQSEQGMLSLAVEEMMNLRDHWKKRMTEFPPGSIEERDAERKSKAYKVTANSFYGVVGSPDSRYFDVEVAESVTQTGAWLIKQTFAAAVARAMRVVYGDTDSTLIADTTSEAFDEFVSWCNRELYPKIIAATGATQNCISLAYEKAFSRLVFPLSADGKPAQKRYVGRLLHKGRAAGGGWNYAKPGAKPEIKGLEFKRGDTNKMTRDLQRAVIDLLAGEAEPTSDMFPTLLDNWQRRIIDDPLAVTDVQRSQELTKEIEEYKLRDKIDGTKTEPPAHVRIAKMLRDRGEDVTVGTRISYVVVDADASPAKVIPADDFDGHLDRRYLWNQMVYAASERVLKGAFPDVDWKKWRLPKLKKAPKNQTLLFEENAAGRILGPSPAAKRVCTS